jgi:hypothetical protein
MTEQSQRRALPHHYDGLDSHSLMSSLPPGTHQPTGTYCLGLGRDPVVVSSHTHLVIATQETGPSDTLIHLADTAIGTMYHFATSGNAIVQVITDAPDTWNRWFFPVAPRNFRKISYPNRHKQYHDKGDRRFFLVMDEYKNRWRIPPGMIAEVASIPHISVLITARPQYAVDLVENFPGVPLVVGNLSCANARRFGLPATRAARLGHGRYAIFEKKSWRFFSTVTHGRKK